MDEYNPMMSYHGYPVRENCTMKDAKCDGRGCRECGFSVGEDERRRKLPLVKLDNGLYGKRVGKRKRPED